MIMIVLLNGQKNKGIFKIGIHIRLIFKEGSWLIEIAFIESPCMGFTTYTSTTFFFLCQGKPLERGNPIRNMKNQTLLRLCEFGCLELYFSNSHVSDQQSDPKMAKLDPKMGQTGSIFN